MLFSVSFNLNPIWWEGLYSVELICGFLLGLLTVNLSALFHQKKQENRKTIININVLVDVRYNRVVPVTAGRKMRTAKAATDLCVLKVIIYRKLQLPQLLLLFLLFLFLLLSQPSFSLFIIVILEFLKYHKAKGSVKGRGIAVQRTGLPTTASMPRTLELRDFHVSDTSYLHSMNACLDFLNTHIYIFSFCILLCKDGFIWMNPLRN